MIDYRKASKNDIDQLIKLRVKQLIDEGYRQINDIEAGLQNYFSESLANGSLICWVGIYEQEDNLTPKLNGVRCSGERILQGCRF